MLLVRRRLHLRNSRRRSAIDTAVRDLEPKLPACPRYRLLAIDIDGTLVNSRNELTPATREAVLRARQAGIEVVLATGRRYSRVLPLVEPLELERAAGHGQRRADQTGRGPSHAVSGRVSPGRARSECWTRSSAAGYDAVLYADTFDAGI